MRSLIFLALIITVAKAVDFQSEALKNYHDCGSISREECLTWHEAQEKCGGCDQSGQTTAQPSGTTAPPDNGDKDKGKGKGKGKGGKKGGGGAKCFHGDDSVMTNYGPMKLKDTVGRDDLQLLSRSDENGLVMSPVMSWLHADAEKVTEFVQLTTESGHELRLTPVHLIYQTDCQGNSVTSFASKVEVDRCIFVNNNGQLVESRVVDKTSRVLKGIYAPVTDNGNVVVNDVLASCFTEFENEALQKVIFKSMSTLRNALSHVMPQSLLNTFMNTPFNNEVNVNQVFLSFMDLVSSFVK